MHDSHILVFIHIGMGTLGILSGFLALCLRKGSPRHRQVGNVFFVSMLTMSAVAACMAYLGTEVTKPDGLNVLQGFLTFYLVATAWLSARHKDGKSGAVDLLAFLAIAALVVGYGVFGLEAKRNYAMGLKDGDPAGLYFAFGAVALLAALGDIRMLLLRGISGVQRIARHLWRMCFALWIAASSLFLGQPQVFPAWLHKTNLLFLPSLAILMAMIYWLIRVLFTGAYKRKQPAPSVPNSAAVLPGELT